MVTTVTTVTTVTAIAALGLSVVVSVAAVITLIAFLASRELASVGNSRFSLRIAKFATIGILPLFMAFGVTVAVKIAELL
jgi:hypothetical protein